MRVSAYSEAFSASSARIKCCGSASMMLHDGDGGDDDGNAVIIYIYIYMCVCAVAANS